jgi:Family of unknown function (DUF5985)
MGALVYVLAILTSLACGLLLLRGYARGKKKLLLWSGLCFLVLAVSNVLVFLDLVIVPTVDLYRWRLIATGVAMALLLYGLIWESD